MRKHVASSGGKKMTPKQSLTRKQSLIRRSLAVLSAALLVAAWTFGISIPASAAAEKGFLQIVSMTDQQSGLSAPDVDQNSNFAVVGPVQNRLFNVAVRVLDRPPYMADGKPDPNAQVIPVSRATTIELQEVSGPGTLADTRTAIIPEGASGATISGARYTVDGPVNNVVLTVQATRGVQLAPDTRTVEIALTAVGDDASPRSPFGLSDPNCEAPTPAVPTCGRLVLPNGANGHVTLSVGSCDGLGACKTAGDIEGLVVTAMANLKDSQGKPLYRKTSPATAVLACDKDLCRELANGVPHLPVFYTLNNSGPADKPALSCPAKGVIGPDQDACVDYVQSSRSKGDLYLFLLFNVDIRYHG